MHCTRRAMLASLALCGPMAAHAQTSPATLGEHPAMRPWQRSERSIDRVLNSRLDLESGERVVVRDYLGGRPTVLAVWATWCPPCLAEKPPMAALQQRLQAAGARAQVKAVLAYDSTRLPEARARLAQLGAGALENARALESAETAFARLFGFGRRSGSLATVSHYQQVLASVLPLTLLFGADGALLGLHQGAMRMAPTSYWLDAETFQLMRHL